jgi:hypothetical protein
MPLCWCLLINSIFDERMPCMVYVTNSSPDFENIVEENKEELERLRCDSRYGRLRLGSLKFKLKWQNHRPRQRESAIRSYFFSRFVVELAGVLAPVVTVIFFFFMFFFVLSEGNDSRLRTEGRRWPDRAQVPRPKRSFLTCPHDHGNNSSNKPTPTGGQAQSRG